MAIHAHWAWILRCRVRYIRLVVRSVAKVPSSDASQGAKFFPEERADAAPLNGVDLTRRYRQHELPLRSGRRNKLPK